MFLIILFFGYNQSIRQIEYHRTMWIETLVGIAKSFASATEAMGHAGITEDGPVYRKILKVHEEWCKDIPNVDYVYTLRQEQQSGQAQWIVSCPVDINHDGIIEGIREVGESLFQPCDPGEWLPIYQQGIDGKVIINEKTRTPVYGDSVTVVVPLRDFAKSPDPSQPSIEAILGVDFRMDAWNELMAQIHSASMQFLALLLVIYLAGIYFTALLSRMLHRVTTANHGLLAAQKAADAATRAKSDFLANMSHEIRTPMNALVGFTDILTQRVLQYGGNDIKEELEGIVEIIRKSSRDVLTIINDILDFSKIEANLLQVDSVPLSIRQVIDDIWQMEMSNVVAKHLDFSIKYKEPIPELILGDPVRLRQILVNLVSNAIKFTEKGSITIQCETFAPSMPITLHNKKKPNDDESHSHSSIVYDAKNPYPGSTMLRIDVIDTGIGIAPSQIEHLFLPFTQVDNSMTRCFGGTGLGLSIAKRLAKLMDGDISATSEFGTGSTFSLILHVYLPANNAGNDSSIYEEKKGKTEKENIGSRLGPGLDIRAPKKDVLAMPISTASAKQGKPLQHARILLVEDMLVNQLVISTQLRDAGAMVEVAGNGKLGIQKILQDSDDGLVFDVVLMDMQMPVMDGYEATITLRKQGYSRPIVAVTAHALTGDREKTIEIGCDDYIAKPVDRKILIDMIKKYLK
jgi:signal transduction histidine kinase